MKEERDFHLLDPTWCHGCGLFGIFAALKKAAVLLDIDPEQLVIVTGIGCHGRLNNYFKTYGFHGLHGRVLPVVTGIKLSNPALFVIGLSGDGDAYSIGLSHFIHSARRNIDLTYLVVDNRLFALTQGQTSPTSQMGYVSISTPSGSKELALDGLKLALASGGTFIARGFSGNPGHLASLIEKGVQHRGFSLIEVLSPCVTHNKIVTYKWFKNRIEPLDEDKSFNPRNREMAWKKLTRTDRIPVGLIYKDKRDSFENLVLPEKGKPLITEKLAVPVDELERLMKSFE